MSLFHGYVGATGDCAQGPQPGAHALMSWYLSGYRSKGARSDGIFNCRHVRGGTALSLHAKGRACDLGCPASVKWASTLATRLKNYSAELGIQCVIFNRRIWSGAHPNEGWRKYDGVDAHTTHLHVELSVAAAQKLTVPRIQAVLQPAKAAIVTKPKTVARATTADDVELTAWVSETLGRETAPRDTLIQWAAANAYDARKLAELDLAARYGTPAQQASALHEIQKRLAQ